MLTQRAPLVRYFEPLLRRRSKTRTVSQPPQSATGLSWFGAGFVPYVGNETQPEVVGSASSAKWLRPSR